MIFFSHPYFGQNDNIQTRLRHRLQTNLGLFLGWSPRPLSYNRWLFLPHPPVCAVEISHGPPSACNTPETNFRDVYGAGGVCDPGTRDVKQTKKKNPDSSPFRPTRFGNGASCGRRNALACHFHATVPASGGGGDRYANAASGERVSGRRNRRWREIPR